MLQTHQIVNEAALAVLRQAGRTDLKTILPLIDGNFDTPARLTASNPVDAKLNISASYVAAADGTQTAPGPVSGKVPNAGATTVNFQTAATTGATVSVEGAAFAIPATTVGQYRRWVLVLKSDGTYDSKFSAAVASLGNLDDAGTLFDQLDGLPVGYVDLEATASTAMKTAGSSTNVIENKVGSATRVFNVRAGGSGGGSVNDFRFASISSNILTIKGGYKPLAGGRVLATFTGFAHGADITVDLSALLATPVNGTIYYVYVDLSTVSETTESTTGLPVYSVSQTNLVLLTTKPELVNRSRYVNLGYVKGAASNTYSTTVFKSQRPQWNEGPAAVSPTVYTLAKQVVGAVGSVGQIAGGHQLDSRDFSTIASAYVWNMLAASLTATFGGQNLSAVAGSVSSNAAGLVGSGDTSTQLAASTRLHASNAAFSFNMQTEAVLIGGWFSLPNWNSGATQYFFAVGTATAGITGKLLAARVNADGTLLFGTLGFSNITVPAPGWSNNSWHHLAVGWKNKTLYVYIDGKLAGTIADADGYSTNDGTVIAFSGRGDGTPLQANALIREAFYYKATFTDADVQKIAAKRIDHNKDVAAENQSWMGSIFATVGYQDLSWMVDKNDRNSVYVDFSALAATDQVSIKMDDKGLSPQVVQPMPPFDVTYNAAPTFPISHNQSGVPAVRAWKEVATNVWTMFDTEGLVKATSTQLDGDLSSVFSGGATRVRLWASGDPNAVGVPDANASRSGTVTTARQNFAGPKVFQDGGSFNANVRASEGAGTTTLTDADNRHQIFNLSAARTCVLPTTGVKSGERWVLENRGAFDLTVQASGGSALTVANGANLDATINSSGYVSILALQDAPTTPAHWLVEDVKEKYTHTTNLTGPVTVNNVAFTLDRRGNLTTLSMQANASGTSSSANPFSMASAIPTRFRSALGGTYGFLPVRDNADQASPGVVINNNNGIIQFGKAFNSFSFISGVTVTLYPFSYTYVNAA